MEELGEIVIAPSVLEIIAGIAADKVEGVFSLRNKGVTDHLSKHNLGRGVYLNTNEAGDVTIDVYAYLEYGVNVPSVAMEIQKVVKSAIFDMAGVDLIAVNVHVVGVVAEKVKKPQTDDLFDEDLLDE